MSPAVAGTGTVLAVGDSFRRSASYSASFHAWLCVKLGLVVALHFHVCNFWGLRPVCCQGHAACNRHVLRNGV